jgi:hypothetical protein
MRSLYSSEAEIPPQFGGLPDDMVPTPRRVDLREDRTAHPNPFVSDNTAPLRFGPTGSSVGGPQKLLQTPRRGLWEAQDIGMGHSGEAFVSGVWVDPYTGIPYQVLENGAPDPKGNYIRREAGVRRKFDALMGTLDFHNPVRRREVFNEDEPLPDVPLEDKQEVDR